MSTAGWKHMRRQLGMSDDAHHEEVAVVLTCIAAELMGVDEGDLEHHDGWIRVKNSVGPKLRLNEVAERAVTTHAGWIHVRHQLGLHPCTHHEDAREAVATVGAEILGVPKARVDIHNGMVPRRTA